MKFQLLAVTLTAVLASCNAKNETTSNLPDQQISLSGTWKLISSKVITGKDTLNTFPVKDQEMIKMFNDTHFSFFKHDLKKGKEASVVFDSGAGTYTLKGNVYEEHLQYCNYRDWENTHFKFTLALNKDILTQTGIEKIDSLNVNQEIIEVYTKVNN